MDVTRVTPVAVAGPRSGRPEWKSEEGPADPQAVPRRGRTRDEHVARPMLEALAAGTDGLPVPARFARSVEPEDALASLDEPARRAEEG